MSSRRHLVNFINCCIFGLFIVHVLFCVSAAPTFYHHAGHQPHQPAARQPYLEVHNSTSHGLGPREEATAACAVRTHELNATANATVTRRLHGVVTSRELHTSIQRLEVIIYGQMQQLWRSLDALRAPAAPPDRRTVRVRLTPGQG